MAILQSHVFSRRVRRERICARGLERVWNLSPTHTELEDAYTAYVPEYKYSQTANSVASGTKKQNCRSNVKRVRPKKRSGSEGVRRRSVSGRLRRKRDPTWTATLIPDTRKSTRSIQRRPRRSIGKTLILKRTTKKLPYNEHL